MKIKNKEYREVPNAYLPSSFKRAVGMIERPYIKITEREYDRIMANTTTDVLADRKGRQYTFGNADGGYALMPLRKECYFDKQERK